MLSCVTKEEFVDFTIQIIEKSMGSYIQFWLLQQTKNTNKLTNEYKKQRNKQIQQTQCN